MTPDREQREQIRRDAEAVKESQIATTDQAVVAAINCVRHCLALLDALEQAEQRRDEAITTAARAMERAFNAEARAEQAERERDEALTDSRITRDVHEHLRQLEARLAAVPALVEALEQIANEENWSMNDGDLDRFGFNAGPWYFDGETDPDATPFSLATDALTAWETTK